MKMRRRFCAFVLGLAAGAMALPVLAAADATREGGAYLVLPTPQPTDTGSKVEVIEFFAYYCPHCYAFEPALQAWVRRHADDVVFRRVHVSRDQNVLPQQRLFFTLEAMGLLEQYHDKVFAAMHVERLRLNSDEQVFDWVANKGIDRARFVDTYRSFGIQQRLHRADAMLDTYLVDRWPVVVVDGRFMTSPSHAGGHAAQAGDEARSEARQIDAALQAMDALVAKARLDKDKAR